MEIILWPFAQLLRILNTTTGSYAMAIFLFALIVKAILFPFSLKGKRSMIQMNMLSSKMQKLQKQYGKDKERYNLEVQKLYEKEKVNPMSGCLWSFVPLLILIPLYGVIRQPMYHMMSMPLEAIATLADSFFDWGTVAVEHGWVTADAMANLVEKLNAGEITHLFETGAYNELFLSNLITPENVEAVKASVGEAGRNIFAINFDMFGLDLAAIPQWKLWEVGFSWQNVGLFLLPVISALLSYLFSKVTNFTNAINNPESVQQQQNNGTMKTMLIMMPLMSLWIGFTMPAGLCVYWIANSLLGMVQEYISALMLKKDYEAARAAAEERERQEKEEEKAHRRAVAEERARQAEEDRKHKNKKKAEKKQSDGPSAGEIAEVSRVGMRTYARGRAYDPDRFGGVTPYREGEGIDDRSAMDKKYDALEQDLEAKQAEETVQAVETAPETAEIPSADEADKD